MSALTPDCDPDMAHCGQPWQGKSKPGAGLLSAAVLMGLLGVSLLVVTKDLVADAFDFVAVPVGVLAAVALTRRGVRLAARGASAVSARMPAVTVRRSQPAA
ncbi:hypothetical protein [Blastococcus xanthinilyticus]|uniref:Uncharacterized protein n=1 Tax=Blastococcus xanthinilyticus TaxID=1564164 RepID=A0A5S5D7J5_9ACTN|nr:hypothetical protein [Blastococcus xanthinilyticus]TYP90579.1 hypothetical protein BD833_101297 [Blastococcus xanthinilyticus]